MLEPARVTRAERELAALARLVGEDDAEAFASLVALRDYIDARTAEAAGRLKERGYSWRELTRSTGMSHKAIQNRYDR